MIYRFKQGATRKKKNSIVMKQPIVGLSSSLVVAALTLHISIKVLKASPNLFLEISLTIPTADMLFIRFVETLIVIMTSYGVLCTQGSLRGETRINIDVAEVCSLSSDNEITADTQTTIRHCSLEISGNQTKVDMRHIRIIGTCDSCVLVFNQQSNDSSHCLQNGTITSITKNGSCPQQREYFKGEVDLLLQMEEQVHPIIRIKFAVYPVSPFVKSQDIRMSKIDVTLYPDGYFTNDPTFQGQGYNFTSKSLMGVTLVNLPLAATVTVDLYEFDAVLPNLQKFIIVNGAEILDLHNYKYKYSKHKQLKLFGSPVIGFVYQTVEGYDRQDEMIHIRYSVQKCNNSIKHLDKLELKETSGLSYQRYTASCLKGFSLLHKADTFRCEDQKWNPPIECVNDGVTHISRDQIQVKATEFNGEVKAGGQLERHIEATATKDTYTASSSSAPITSIIAITLSLMTALLMLLILYCYKVRVKDDIPARQNLSQPRVQDLAREAARMEGNINSVSDYEFIEKTDPYLDYCEIDECNMMSDVNRSISVCDSKRSAVTTGKDTNTDLISEPSFPENLTIPSSDLLGSISREFSKRGVNIQHKPKCSEFSDKARPNDRAKMKMPNTPPMLCRGPRVLRVFAKRPQTIEAEVHINSSEAEHNKTLQTRHQHQPIPGRGSETCPNADQGKHPSNNKEKPTPPVRSWDFEDALSVYRVYTLDNHETL